MGIAVGIAAGVRSVSWSGGAVAGSQTTPQIRDLNGARLNRGRGTKTLPSEQRAEAQGSIAAVGAIGARRKGGCGLSASSGSVAKISSHAASCGTCIS